MMFLVFTFFVGLFSLSGQCFVESFSENFTASQTNDKVVCNVPIDSLALDTCLKPFEKQWNVVKKSKPQLDMVAIPLLIMERKEMAQICDVYHMAQENCSAQMMACNQHEMSRLAMKNFDYACQLKSDFRNASECLFTTVQNNPQCIALLKKANSNVNDCKQISSFYKCIQPFVEVQCKAKGLAALVHALDHYGCDVNILQEDPKITECDLNDQQAVSSCFQPLINYWTQLRLNDSANLDGIAFPLFHFKSADIVHMCDLVTQIKDDCSQLIRCPSHPIPTFTNGLLAVACGPQQSLFFLSFDCIKNAIKANEQCSQKMPGVWSPGMTEDSCWHIPPFFDCMKDQILARCSAEGFNVFAQSLKQFGCNVETADWSGSWVALPPGIPQNFVNGSLQTPSHLSPANPLFNAQGLLEVAVPPPAPIPDTFRPEPPRPPPPSNVTSNGSGIAFAPSSVGQAPGAVPLQSDAAPGPQIFRTATTQGLLVPPGLVPAPNFAPPPAVPPASNSVQVLKPQLLPDGAPQSLFSLTGSAPGINAPLAPSSARTTIAPTTVQQRLSTANSSEPPVSVAVPVQLQGAFGSMVEPMDVCSKVRQCLQPLFKHWLEVQKNRNLNNLTFPTFHYDKKEIMELCDFYAGSFLNCNHSSFGQCLQDEIVFLANSVFGYLCSPQNVVSFMQNFECITLTVRNRPICEGPIKGPLVMGRDLGARCQGIHDYYVCNRLPIDRACGSEALKHVQESIKQFGCVLDAR